MLRALILATLVFVVPRADAVQALSVLHIKVVLVDAGQRATPVSRHVLLVSDNPASAPPRRVITSLDGIFFWQRVLFGLVGPAVLSYLTWETAKIRSTQSATGILYVDFFTVVVGEVLAKYLLLATRVPL